MSELLIDATIIAEATTLRKSRVVVLPVADSDLYALEIDSVLHCVGDIDLIASRFFEACKEGCE